MTREEYINFANALKNNYTIDFDKLPEFCDMAVSALSENKGEWIPVTERLPLFGKYKVSDDVLITDGYEINMGYLVKINGKIFWHYYGSELEVVVKDEDNDVRAWMPLPEPYKPESED